MRATTRGNGPNTWMGAVLLATLSLPSAVSGEVLRGRVVDATGAPIPGARLRLLGAETTSAPDGGFQLAGPAGPARLRVTGNGFATQEVDVSLPAESLRLVLQPAGFSEAVTVTASRGSSASTPAAISVVTAAELLGRAPAGVDDALRHTPGFSLFRRASARVANPTTQGVTLRGVSGSGASRTLVLADGQPLNDPFGSWVYWNRVPIAALERIEVARGAGGDLYGADALGGVIQLLSFEPDVPRLRLVGEAGSHDSGRLSGYASGSTGPWSGAATGEWASGGDVPVVPPEERGAVDVPAGSDHWSGALTLGYQQGAWRARLQASQAFEERRNGTPAQVNDTDWRRLSALLGGSLAGGALEVRAATGDQTYRQSFSAVSGDRESERLTTRQRVPARVSSGAAQWARPFGRHVALVGVEARQLRATVAQTRFSFTGEVSPPVLTGGLETTGAAFSRVRLQAPASLSVVLAARFDTWRSEPREGAGDPRSVGFWSPRVAVEWRPRSDVTGWAAFSRASRTPTLNELFRGFRVGNVVTGANPSLDPERLTTSELGVSWSSERGSLRATAFYSLLEDAIANVTLSVDSELILRERRNAGEVRARGLELEAELRPHRALRLGAFVALTDSRFRGTPQLPELEDKRVPQVPRLHLGASVDWSAPLELNVAAQLRFTGEQFDDDRNELALGAFGVLDLMVSRRVTGGVQAFVAVENLLDVEYDIARTPTRSVGWPRSVRAGLRVFLP